MKKAQKYSIMDNKRSGKGKLSVILAVVSAAALLICIVISVLAEGQGGTYLGAIGLAAILLSFYGCFLCIKELRGKKNRVRITYLGAALCGIMFFIWLAVLLAGIKH